MLIESIDRTGEIIDQLHMTNEFEATKKMVDELLCKLNERLVSNIAHINNAANCKDSKVKRAYDALADELSTIVHSEQTWNLRNNIADIDDLEFISVVIQDASRDLDKIISMERG